MTRYAKKKNRRADDVHFTIKISKLKANRNQPIQTSFNKKKFIKSNKTKMLRKKSVLYDNYTE